MSSNGKKEYSLIINGVEKYIQDFIKLNEVVVVYDSTMSKASQSGKNFSTTTKTNSKSLTDEEKAAKKLADTEKRLEQVKNGATKAQIAANQELQKATRATTLQVKESMAAENSIEKMRIQLSLMKEEWKGMDVGSEAFQQMSADILELNNRIKEAEMSTGDFRRNVGNYESALEGLGKLSEGVEGATKSTMGLAQGLLGANALMGLFGKENEESAEQAAKLQKILALLSLVEQVNTNVLKEGIIQNKLAVVTDGIRATQLKAKTAAETASTKGTIAATMAQKVFNAVAAANPYVLLALALATVTAGLYAFASGSSNAKREQTRLNAEIESTKKQLLQIKNDTDFNVAIAEAAGESVKELQKIKLEAAKTAEAISYANYMSVLSSKSASKEQIEAAKKANDEAYDNLKGVLNEMSIMEVRQQTEEQKRAEEQAKKMSELAKKRAEEAKNLMEKQVSDELNAIRTKEDAELALEKDNDAAKLRRIELSYNRQIEDLTSRLAEDKTLTENAKSAINDTIIALEEQKNTELKLIRDEAAKRENEELVKELKSKTSLQLSELDIMANLIKERQDKMTDRKGGGLNLIDVDATRDNLREMDSVLNEYIGGLSGYLDKLKVSHEAALSTLKKGTPEYEAEMQNYAKATEDANKRIKEAQDKQAENAKLSSGLTLDYWKDFTGKLAEQAQAAADAIGMITDVLNQALQAQLDELNEQMDALNEQYDNAQAKREEHASKVEELENKLENASGARADAIRDELKEEVNARDKAQREEEKIAKQKEKLEAQIAKKEKQMKRNELISNIAIGLANVAQAVTKALTAGPIVGQVLAGITAALGAVQVGIMTKQLAKLEKGGEIIGPSHANGGVPIPGTNYEAEGGEFVVNKVSYGANEGLIRFINDTPRGVTMADLMGVVPAGSAPVVSSTMTSSGEDRIVEAIKGIEMRPVVAVTDVIDAMDEVTEIRDLAGV